MRRVRQSSATAQKPQNLVVIGIGASAGGIKSLTGLLPLLDRDLPVCVVVVLHLDPTRKSTLPELLQRHCAMRVQQAKEQDQLRPGTVYTAPPNAHLVIAGNRLHLESSPPVHFSRPSIDRFFDSLARELGVRSVGVLLSGAGKDGAEGLCELKRAGGLTIVQEPGEAGFPSMPASGIATGCVDFVLPLQAIAERIATLCQARQLHN